MSEYLKLDKAPRWVLTYPQCSACDVDLELNDGWICPSCGTYWPSEAGDDDEGELYESWDGEELHGPVVSHEEASDIAYREARRAREAFVAELLRKSGGAA